MRNIRSLVLLILVLLLSGMVSHAQERPNHYIEKRYSIFFRVGKANVDQTYLENSHVISTMISDIRTTLETHTPDSLVIYASSSPEGSVAFNESLAKKRATATKDYILNVLPELKNAHIKIESRTNDWSGMLQTFRSDATVQYRDEILRILTDPNITNKETVLRRSTAAFAFIRDNMLHKMRTATVTIRVIGKVDEFAVEPELTITADSLVTFPADGGVRAITYKKNASNDVLPTVACEADWVENITTTADSIVVTAKANPLPEVRMIPVTISYFDKTHKITLRQDAAEPIADTVAKVESDSQSTILDIEQGKESEKRPYYLSVKTNMLYDAALVPNIGVDIYLGKNFSLVGNWMYSWWKNDNVHWYWRTYGGDFGVHYWFGKSSKVKPLQGHHVGLYGQIITYDFELGGRGYLGDRWTYGGGVEYGYSLPIGKRLNLDLDLGFGYLGGEFKEYLPIDGHYVWQATKRRQYIGPTKAEISLVWLLGRGNINAEKGGKR